jgi:D-alanine-D-alanine ligase
VAFVHEQLQTDVVVEEYIEGREMYVGIMGNVRLEAFPLRELLFKNLPEDAPRIMTQKLKTDLEYQKKAGVVTETPADLPEGAEATIHKLCKRVYRTLGLSGYARMDVRLTESGKVYLLEPNPNPELTYGEDFSEAASKKGIGYEELIQRILNLGLRYQTNRLHRW